MVETSSRAVERRTFLVACLVLLLTSTRAATAQNVSLPETWMVDARLGDQPQARDVGASFSAAPIDETGRILATSTDPRGLFARIAGRPIVVAVHGNNYTREEALKEGVRVRTQLASGAGWNADSVFLIMHWPSEREGGLVRDLNEKTRQSQWIGYQFAQLLTQLPAHTRITLMGQSNGARIILSAVHLLRGETLEGYHGIPEFRLASSRPDLRVRLILLEAAVGHNWLGMGARLDGAVPASEAILNLYNRLDLALLAYPHGRYTGFRPALGRLGLTPHDRQRLGPLSGRVAQYELHAAFGSRHVLFPEALTVPEITQVVASYTRW